MYTINFVCSSVCGEMSSSCGDIHITTRVAFRLSTIDSVMAWNSIIVFMALFSAAPVSGADPEGVRWARTNPPF